MGSSFQSLFSKGIECNLSFFFHSIIHSRNVGWMNLKIQSHPHGQYLALTAWAGIPYPVSSASLLYGSKCYFYYVEVPSLYTQFVGSFSLKWMLNLVKCFFSIYWDDYLVFILHFVDMVYHIDWFVDVEKSLHPRDESHVIMVCDSFNVLLNSIY